MTETEIRKSIQATLSRGDTRLWRNNVGEAWVGKSLRVPQGILIRDPYRVTYGLAPGSADLIGYRSAVITPQMVGQRLAILASIEVKSDRRGRKQPGQQEWSDMVTAAGGLAGFASSVDQAQAILDGDTHD
jgi:hypothetical protein